MEQCPICMLFLLPGMNLQDHLDTHPKDMIIKALLSAKNEPEAASATVFLSTPSTHLYQDQQQNQQPIQHNFNIANRHPVQNGAGTLLFNKRPYRLTIDAPSQAVQATPTPTTTTMANSSNYGTRSGQSDSDLFENKPTAFRCIQNTEQKNIMIVNTSSTQFIQQTLPMKNQNTSTAAIELHPVIIDSGMPIRQNAISIIPRYTSEKYSGPPPSYSTAVSSVTNTINDKPRVIDLTQTSVISAMKILEKPTCSGSNSNNSNKITSISSATLGGEEKQHLMITSTPHQNYLEFNESECGEYMLIPPTSSVSLSHEEEVVASGETDRYNIKFVDIDNHMTYGMASEDDVDKNQEEDQELVEIIDDGKEVSYTCTPIKNDSGVKVLSDVKLTCSEMLSPSIKDIIQQYNYQTEKKILENEERREEKPSECEKEMECSETMSSCKEESTSAACTSVIRKITGPPEPQPSTSGCSSVSVAKSNAINITSLNRLKINKQPKKLVVKLRKPLFQGSVKSQHQLEEPEVTIKDEVENDRAIILTETVMDSACFDKKPIKPQMANEPFDTSFLEHHDYEHKIEVTPEIHHDSETNQSLMSMDLEPESHVKREKTEDNFSVVIKSEQSSSSTHASLLNSESVSSSSRADQQLNIDSVVSANDNSPLNFLYQNDRGRFSPPLSPYVYLKTYSSSQSRENLPKQETEADISWNESNSFVVQNSEQNSTCSRYTPSFDDNRSNYTDLDGGNNRTNSSMGEVHVRASSNDSLNIRTDEKMPARGEISEQESNGEIEQPWHHPYFQLQAYPSSYDMNTAQECWNLSKADSQNACDSNNVQNVIINFSPLNADSENMETPDLLKTIMQTVTKQEPSGIENEAGGSNSNMASKRSRTFRCPECSKFFTKLRARNRHIEQAHPLLRRIKKPRIEATSTQTSKSEPLVFPSSSSAMASWNATTTTATQEHEINVLSIIKSEPSTSAAVLVKNEMNRILISTTGSIKMEMDRLLMEPSTSTSNSQLSTLGLKIKRTYMCAKCNEQFRTLKLLDKHFQIHPAECTLCQKTFNSWNTFSLHLKHHLNIRVHACRFCPKRFVQKQRLVEHERVHTGSMPIKCPNCEERFRRYSNMLHHRARVHLNKRAKQEDFVCDCGEVFQTKAKLEWHQETHENKPKPCPFCRERFTHRNSLTRHIRLSHTDKYVFAKSKAVSCPICNSTYLPSSIKAHMQTHQNANKEYSCSICNKQFSTKWNLKQHHWTHANRSTKPFQCNVCPSAFVRETDYTTHMNAHRSIKPFTCNTCGKRFVRKYNWLRHSREHEREKKFVCETCNKKFHRAYYLTEHKRVHTGERPFSCTICGKTSATKTNHNKHIKIHHARDPLTAEG